MATVIAYLDTQAFDHIYKKIGCTGADVANLRKAIYGRQLSIRLSIHTLEEILLARKVSPQAFAAQIKLTLSLASSRTLVKPCAQLLFDDIRAYSTRGQADRPFLSGEPQNAVADGIGTLIESDGEEVEDDFLAVLEQAQQQKQDFFATLEQARRQAETVPNPTSGSPSLEHFFDTGALPLLGALIKRAGVEGLTGEHSLKGLLEIKSVRMSLCAALAPSFDQAATGAANFNAIHHAVSAAAVAETYVSDESANRKLLEHLPIEGLTVSGLSEFLKRLSSDPAPETT
jgi:hypothetical protein